MPQSPIKNLHCKLKPAPPRSSPVYMPFLISVQAALRVIGRALDILGGIGILREYPIEKMIRDLLTFLHGDGTDSLNLLRAAQTLDEPA